MIYVIEHLEPFLSKWVCLEYRHISSIAGKRNVIFTNIKRESDAVRLRPFGGVIPQSVVELKLKRACVLDPAAKKALNPKDAERFSYLVFGGILGDAPMKGRTGKALTSKLHFPSRNLGKKQMSTDTAVTVSLCS